jgi:hypothetical protein
MAKDISIFNKTSFDKFSNDQLLNLWNNLEYTDVERYFLYKQMTSRNIIHLIKNQSKGSYKVNEDEIIYTIFEQGFLSSGGCITITDFLIYILPLIIIIACRVLIKINIIPSIIFNIDMLTNCNFLLVLFSILMLTNSFFQRFIILTNKSIGTYTVLFRAIKFNFKKISIDQNNQAFTKLSFYMVNGHKIIYSNLLKSIYIIFDIFFLNSNHISFRCMLNSYKLLLLQEWLQLIFNNKLNNIYLFNVVHLINFSLNYDITYTSSYSLNSLYDFFKIIDKISDSQLINYDKSNNLVSIKNLLALKYNKNKCYNCHINIYNNHLFFDVYSVNGVIGHVILVNTSIFFIDKRKYSRKKYTIIDNNLFFHANSTYGISFYYQKKFLFYIRYLDISFPFLDYLFILKNGDLNV